MPLVTLERRGRGAPRAEWVPYEPHGAARELMRRRDRELVIEGPADSGKSMGCLNKLLLMNLNHANNRTAMVRATRKSLTQSTMVSFKQKVLPPGLRDCFHEGDQEYRFPNGSVCVVGGLDDPGKLFSTEFDAIYVNEIDQITVDAYEALLTRCTGRWGAMPYSQLFGDLNPTYPGHFLYGRETAGLLTVLFARHEDNPTITPERLAALDALTGYRYKRMRLGLRVAPEGMYFDEWDPEVHVCEGFDIPKDWPRWLAVDYGFAAPFCCLWLARSPDRRIYVYRELYAPGLRDEQQADLIAERSAGERIVRRVADPSMFAERREQGKPSIAKVYEAHRVPLEPATNQRVAGWNAVRRALAAGDDKPPRLQVFREACPNLIRTLPAMVHDPLDPEDLADEINHAKTEDHAVDALRYALMSEGQERVPDQEYGLGLGEKSASRRTPDEKLRRFLGPRRGVNPFAKSNGHAQS